MGFSLGALGELESREAHRGLEKLWDAGDGEIRAEIFISSAASPQHFQQLKEKNSLRNMNSEPCFI